MALKELIMNYPTISIIVIAFVITLGVTLINKFFTDQNRIKEIKKKQKDIQSRIKEHNQKGETDKVLELQKEIMNDSMELFKHSLKPTIITLIPLLLIFWWIKDIYTTTAIAKTWFWYYLGSALISSVLLRKILDVA